MEQSGVVAEINSLTLKMKAEFDLLELSKLHYDRAHLFGEIDDRQNAIRDYKEAFKYAQTAEPSGKPYIASIQTMMGLEFMLQGKKEAALYWTLAAIDKDPTNALLHYNFGLVCSNYKCELFHIAIGAFRKTIELDPDNEDAKIKLGESLREAYLIPESTEVLSKYVTDHPDDARGWYELARTNVISLTVKDHIDLAHRNFVRALQANPSEELRALIEERLRRTTAGGR